MSRLTQTIKIWIPFAVIGSALVLLNYTSTQQNYRQTSNDPQIQMAEDAANALGKGASPQSVVPTDSIDMGASLAPFIIVTDSNGKVIASSATLDGSTPIPPMGALTAKDSPSIVPGYVPGPENRFTWEPKNGVRLAAVVTHYSGTTSGYVIAARNLREVENRESQLVILAGLDYLGLLVGSFIVILVTV